MNTQTDDLAEFLELVNRYPSPHNGQPIRMKRVGKTGFELYFETKRGLQAAEISYLFSFVTMGLFVTYFSMCAEAFGHKATITTHLPKLSDLKQEGLLHFATVAMNVSVATPNNELKQSLLFRQTSRKKYHAGISERVTDFASKLAMENRMQLVKMDTGAAEQAIWLNQRAVFDDMFDDAVRKELNHWLRYSQEEKQAAKDGLAYDCMELNGSTMKFIVNHPKILRAPGISRIIQAYYLRTMKDKSDVFYMLTPFKTEQDAFTVGEVIMKVWQATAADGSYLHPFGTIMSNEAAHADFLKLVGVEHEDMAVNFLSFIYRTGQSKTPTPSMRLPIENHLIME